MKGSWCRAVAGIVALVALCATMPLFAGGDKEQAPDKGEAVLEAGFRAVVQKVGSFEGKPVPVEISLMPLKRDPRFLQGPKDGPVWALFNLDIRGKGDVSIDTIGAEVVLDIWSTAEKGKLAVFVFLDGGWKALAETDLAKELKNDGGRAGYLITHWPLDDLMVCLDG